MESQDDDVPVNLFTEMRRRVSAAEVVTFNPTIRYFILNIVL